MLTRTNPQRLSHQSQAAPQTEARCAHTVVHKPTSQRRLLLPPEDNDSSSQHSTASSIGLNHQRPSLLMPPAQQIQSAAASPAKASHKPPHLVIAPDVSPPAVQDGTSPTGLSQQSLVTQGLVMPSSDSQQSMQYGLRPTPQRRHPFLSLFLSSYGQHTTLDPSLTPLATPRAGLVGLRFIQAQGNQDCEGSWAVSALAEGAVAVRCDRGCPGTHAAA